MNEGKENNGREGKGVYNEDVEAMLVVCFPASLFLCPSHSVFSFSIYPLSLPLFSSLLSLFLSHSPSLVFFLLILSLSSPSSPPFHPLPPHLINLLFHLSLFSCLSFSLTSISFYLHVLPPISLFPFLPSLPFLSPPLAPHSYRVSRIT